MLNQVYQEENFGYAILNLSIKDLGKLNDASFSDKNFDGIRISQELEYYSELARIHELINVQNVPEKKIILDYLQTKDQVYEEVLGQGLMEFPDLLLKFKHIKYLDLSYHHITQLPTWLIQLNNLERLKLNHNRISNLSDIDWSQLNRLLAVNFKANLITEAIPMSLQIIIEKNGSQEKQSLLKHQIEEAVKNKSYEYAAQLKDLYDNFGIHL